MRLARHFADRDALSREAAVRRLRDYGALARGHVVQTFREGNLANALDGAGVVARVAGPDRGIGSLAPRHDHRRAAGRVGPLGGTPLPMAAIAAESSRPLSPQELADARREIARLLRADSAAAPALRHRLSRLGKALLPEVYAELRQVTTDQQRERLVALRYDLVASGSLPLRWPGGIDRLAATDNHARHKAIGELESLATADDEPLLLELFSDPDPLVREVSLRAIQKLGGSRATSALVRLLEDPDSNVRAAVLKQLSENPAPELVGSVAAYIAKEKDPDLIVHAIRFFRGRGRSRDQEPDRDFESPELASGPRPWKRSARSTSGRAKAQGRRGRRVQEIVRAALLARLDDPDAFVVSRTLQALPRESLATAIEPMLAWRTAIRS